MQTEPQAVVSIFASSAPQDKPLEHELKEHLRPLQREGLIELWHDRDMSAGTAWEQQSSEHLNSAQIILLLVSIDYLNSDYCSSVEMKRALERHERGEARVFPIILRPVYWQRAPFGKLQVLPRNGKPITTWPNLEEALLDVVQALSQVVDQILHQPKRA